MCVLKSFHFVIKSPTERFVSKWNLTTQGVVVRCHEPSKLRQAGALHEDQITSCMRLGDNDYSIGEIIMLIYFLLLLEHGTKKHFLYRKMLHTEVALQNDFMIYV